jgi:hypothetical protein
VEIHCNGLLLQLCRKYCHCAKVRQGLDKDRIRFFYLAHYAEEVWGCRIIVLARLYLEQFVGLEIGNPDSVVVVQPKPIVGGEQPEFEVLGERIELVVMNLWNRLQAME